MNQPISTKTRMITATAELLQVQGYHATGLNQITQESSTPKGSLYFHFPGGKEELAIAAIEAAGAEESQKIEAVLNSQEDVGDAIHAFTQVLAQGLLDSDFRKGCPVATVAIETSSTHESLRRICEQIYLRWFELIEQRLLAAGFSAAETKTWATLILASVEGALLLSRNQKTVQPLEIIGEHLRVLINQAKAQQPQEATVSR
ncbi:MAG: TetR/AcrR family transcriptional regulator [Leptolyngbyaceae cyanobacterium RM2_2_4]|nr:TetR/AcrR family transcriptional regulator [Leptolyngbyaceae cyanobacterium SM1_4_3]NJO52193.1 TetR/AcrR family transcriptional regulator [Leptolyngbyaceae cyanobacterium RM2_2_4]